MTLNNGNLPANAIFNSSGHASFDKRGFSKRERFAMAAMQGLCASGRYTIHEDLASDAVEFADALLEKLEK